MGMGMGWKAHRDVSTRTRRGKGVVLVAGVRLWGVIMGIVYLSLWEMALLVYLEHSDNTYATLQMSEILETHIIL